MSLMSWIFFCLVLFLPNVVRGTLTPSGTVAVDCGGQLTFTCNVTGITTNSQAGWTIMGLVNITASGSNGLATANTNPRITGTGGNVPISTITIADFTMSDNGGTVQCINTDDISDQGTATISVATPSCPNVSIELNDECTSVNVTWEQPDTTPVTFTTVTYYPTSSLNNGDSMNCTSPCTIDGLTSTEDHNFTVIPSNNCGHATGCKIDTPVRGIPMCPSDVTIFWKDDMSAHVTWQQPSNTPLVTSTTVMYCLSPSNCTNMTCSVSPCNIIGLDSCQDYSLTVIPNNNCGSPTQCNNNTLSGGTPGVEVEISRMTGLPSNVTITWQPNGSFPQITYITVTYCPTSSSDCGDSMNCATNCTISGLDPRTRYNFTITPMSICGSGMAVIEMLDPVDTPEPPTRELPIVAIVVSIVAAIILVVLGVIIVIVVVIWCMKKKHGVKDNSSAKMSRLRSNEERVNLGEDTYASPGTEKPQPETTDGVYSYAATETKIGAQMKEREQQKKQPPPQGDFYEEPNAAKKVQHKAGTITGETYAQPDKPKRGTKKKDKQKPEPVSHKETPAGDLYAMPDKKKDVSHTSGPVTGDEYAVASKPKTEGGYSAHGPQ